MTPTVNRVLGNKELTMTSREIAELTGKRPADVMRDLRKLDSKIDEYDKLKKSTYTDAQTKERPCYILNLGQLNMYIHSKNQSPSLKPLIEFYEKNINPDAVVSYALSSRDEDKFYKMMATFFPGETIYRQVPVGRYRLDFVIGDIVVEYDEEQHQYNTEQDKARIVEVKSMLDTKLKDYKMTHTGNCGEGTGSYRILRVQKGKEIDGLRKLTLMLLDHDDWQLGDLPSELKQTYSGKLPSFLA